MQKKIEVFIEQGCFIQADFTEKDFTDAGALVKKKKRNNRYSRCSINRINTK